ncbi:MAG TPA: glucokinase, partial [Vicinamibacterales bacterium]
MLLAGDVGGTKTFLGLFARSDRRPDAVDTRSYRTLDFSNLGALCLQFRRETSTDPADIDAVSFGVAGPV